jgi:hypothetical protein
MNWGGRDWWIVWNDWSTKERQQTTRMQISNFLDTLTNKNSNFFIAWSTSMRHIRKTLFIIQQTFKQLTQRLSQISDTLDWPMFLL